MIGKRTRRWLAVFCLAAFGAVVLTAPALAEPRQVGVLESFQGGVTLKHKGVWGVVPAVGMTLMHGDKILTKPDGACAVRFHDDALLKIKPNSSVRVAELMMANEARTRLEQKREIRLFVGNLQYTSGGAKTVATMLVAPTAVAALRGTDVEFGTDGLMAMLNQIQGDSDLAGAATRVDAVPDTTIQVAGANRDYKASMAADQIRNEYMKAVQSMLESMRLEKREILLAAAGGALPFLLPRMLVAASGVSTAHKVLILAALYALADANAMGEENSMLVENPDETVRMRALKALRDSRQSMEMAKNALREAKETAVQINGLIQQALSGDPTRIKAALAQIKPVIQNMIATQKQVNQQALGRGYQSNAETAGFDDRLNQDDQGAPDEEEEAAGREIAGEFLSPVDQAAVEEWIEIFLSAVEEDRRIPEDEMDATIEDIEQRLGETEPSPLGPVTDASRDKRQEEREPRQTDDMDGDGIPNSRDLDPGNPDVGDDGGYGQ